jgi:haloalkane dehalogenase
VAVCECHLRPIDSWADTDDGFRDLFTRLRAAGPGEQLVIEENMFVESVLLGSLPWLSEAEREAYRAPFAEPGRRASILRLVRDIPIAGEPVDVVLVMDRIATLLADPASGQLVLAGRPGAVITDATLGWIARTARGVDVVDVGPGGHFLPEERPEQIATAIHQWLTDR